MFTCLFNCKLIKTHRILFLSWVVVVEFYHFFFLIFLRKTSGVQITLKISSCRQSNSRVKQSQVLGGFGREKEYLRYNLAVASVIVMPTL